MRNFIPEGFCNFVDCFNRIGKAEFGASWTGEEFTAKKIPSPEERARLLEKTLKGYAMRNRPAAVEGAPGHSTSVFVKRYYPTSKAELLKILAQEAKEGASWEGLNPESEEYSKRHDDLLKATLRRDKTLEILRQWLYAGRMVALLLRPQREEPEEVPMHTWANDNQWNSAVTSGRFEETNILFRIADVETAISGTTLPNAGKTAATTTVGAEKSGDGAPAQAPRGKPTFKAKIRQAYKERVDNWPDGERCPSQKEDEGWGRDNFSASRDFMRELKKEVAPPEWSKTGPKTGQKNKPNNSSG